MRILNIVFVLGVLLAISSGINAHAQKPNVIVVISDDQGYGDLGSHGNPWLKTPKLDEFYEESARLTDFHVSTSCAPTRAALLSGHYSNRTGVWHTVGGRSLIKEDEVLLPEILAAHGFNTAMFGKWHLGDNYPFRPQDKGFDHVVMHMGGGVGQQPDYWENDYFNDTYFKNGVPQKFHGYCTDVWFEEAMDYMDEQLQKENPFFVYLSTNAPHGPYYVADEFSAPYENREEIVNAGYYGMVANLDCNFGRLEAFLKNRDIDENTILIFMTDNGVANGSGVKLDWSTGLAKAGYNAGMRGTKISEYEGGHRVPFLVRWPDGKIKPGVDVNDLSAHIDFVPTVLDWLAIPLPDSLNVDGVSLKDRLQGKGKPLNDRVVVVDNQRVQYPEKWKNTSVMQDKWRLVNNKELYNIEKDPGQQNDVSGMHPELMEQLREEYDDWWNDIKPEFEEFPAIAICPPEEELTLINTMDMHPDGKNTKVPWHQKHIRKVVLNTGWYALNVQKTGIYKVSLFRYPPESRLAINASAPQSYPERGTNVEPYAKGDVLDVSSARIVVDGKTFNSEVDANNLSCSFKVKMEKGWQKFRAEFKEDDSDWFAAFYVEFERIK